MENGLMPEHVIVWDLETIPDIEAAGRMLDMERASEAEIRAALGPGFPKHPLHKVACIGALIAARSDEGWRIEALGAPHIGERSESELIRAFIDRIGELCPQLITFNGHSFDLPVLRYRAMVNRISAVGLQVRNYFHRYTEDALDLCDVFGSYGFGAKTTLDQICKIMDLPGKPHGVDGTQVDEMVRAGRIQDVAHYCEGDVLNTYRLWLIYALFRGSISPQEFRFSEDQAREFVRARQLENQHLLTIVGIGPTPRSVPQ
jgi:3'-5' exonuclease